MLPALAAAEQPWRWQPHPEVWLLVVGVVGLYVYAIRRIGPRATLPGEPVVTKAQLGWFAGAVAVLWVASDWPMHDVGEEYLYGVHMVQHLLLQFALAPLVLLATPAWLARLVVGNGAAYRVLRGLTRFVPAALIFNGVVVFTHWPAVVNASVENGPLHYAVHVLVVFSAFVMWMPVCGPLAELRFTRPMQMVFLFVQSVIPTVPAGWLTFADGAVYRAYDRPFRLFGLDVGVDQQIAGLVMKLGGGLFLWTVIAVLFFKWANRDSDDHDHDRGAVPDRRAPRPAPAPAVAPAAAPGASPAAPPPAAGGDVLTWEQVQRELERAGPPPSEPER